MHKFFQFKQQCTVSFSRHQGSHCWWRGLHRIVLSSLGLSLLMTWAAPHCSLVTRALTVDDVCDTALFSRHQGCHCWWRVWHRIVLSSVRLSLLMTCATPYCSLVTAALTLDDVCGTVLFSRHCGSYSWWRVQKNLANFIYSNSMSNDVACSLLNRHSSENFCGFTIASQFSSFTLCNYV